MGRPDEPQDLDQQWAPVSPPETASPADAGAPEQPAYGQDPDGRPQYRQQDHERPAYSQQQYGQQQYDQQQQHGQQQYGQQPPPTPQHQYPPHQYGQPQYGQQYYAQPPYGQAPYGQAPPQPYGQQAYQQARPNLGQPSEPVHGMPDQGRASGSKKLWIGIIGGAIAALIIAALVIWWLIPTYFTTTVLDQEAIQNGVMGVLVDADVSPSEVSCPSGVKVEVGTTFTCDAVISGSTKQVVSTITSDNGNYDVALPPGS